LSRVYTFSVPDGYDLEAAVKRARGGARISRSALILRALEEYGGGAGDRIDHYMGEQPIERFMRDCPHDDLVEDVRGLVERSPGQALRMRERANTLVRLIDYATRDPPGPPGVS